MSETSDADRASRLDEAIAESQRLEREERNAHMAKQSDADERIVKALSDNPPSDEQAEQRADGSSDVPSAD